MEQIYSSSFELFSKHGFQKVSVNEIAENANVSPATIYNYFGTKEQLFTDMLMNWMDRQLEQYEKILDAASSFPDKAKDILLLEAKNLKVLSDHLRISPFTEVGDLKQIFETYSEQKIIPFFMKFVAIGKQEEFIRSELTEEMIMLYFHMYKNELVRHWKASNQEQIANIDQLMELFFYGLVGEKQE